MSIPKKWKMRRSWIALFIAVGLMVAAGAASATPLDDSEDTDFNFGYDQENHVLMANTSATDFTYDCTLENGTLIASYGDDPESDQIPVDKLEVEPDVAVEFPNRPGEEVGSDYEPAEDPVAYTTADGDCGLFGVVVGGAQGQINHGQFMKALHLLFDMRGRGCLNRVIAQSDLGKGDQQLRTSDADPEFVIGDSGSVDFTTVAADCKRGKKDKGEDHPGHANGLDKSAKSNKAGGSGSPGKSGSAPGRNK